MVIGGTGNMGSHAVDLLLKKGYELHILTRGRNAFPPNLAARV